MDAYGPLLTIADWSNVAYDIGSIGGALAALYVVFRGVRLVLGMISGDDGRYF